MVRRFQPGDGPAVRRLHRTALRAAGTDPAHVPGNDDLNFVGETDLNTGGEFLVAERDGRIVACGGLLVAGSSAELKRIAVAPVRQRDGLGTDIVTGLETAARARDCDRILVRTAARQSGATQFYPELGYERVGSHREAGYDLIDFENQL